jgi:hypothetical protein
MSTSEPTAAEAPPAPAGGSIDKQNRAYVPAKGRSGVIFRKGTNETVDEAYARDAKPKPDRPPKRKKAPTVAKAPAPTSVDLKELEFLICEALKAPAMVPVALGDEWPAAHMMAQAPVFARNLTKAAEHNPWLRAKLENMMTGEDFLIKLVTTGAVAGAAFMYAAPVLLYYATGLRHRVPEQAIEMLGVPDRREIQREREEAERASAESAAAAAANGSVAAAA